MVSSTRQAYRVNSGYEVLWCATICHICVSGTSRAKRSIKTDRCLKATREKSQRGVEPHLGTSCKVEMTIGNCSIKQLTTADYSLRLIGHRLLQYWRYSNANIGGVAQIVQLSRSLSLQ